MAEHTKGPWIVEPLTTGDSNVFCISSEACPPFGDMPDADTQANANLIAAAPELLEALCGLVDDAKTLAAAFDDPESEVAPFIVIADNAIAKAKGGT